MKHTKGEWGISKHYYGYKILIDGNKIADVWNKRESYAVTEEEALANAKLIASAPELLKALNLIQEYINKMGVVSIAMTTIKNTANKAIKKATT